MYEEKIGETGCCGFALCSGQSSAFPGTYAYFPDTHSTVTNHIVTGGMGIYFLKKEYEAYKKWGDSLQESQKGITANDVVSKFPGVANAAQLYLGTLSEFFCSDDGRYGGTFPTKEMKENFKRR